MLPIPGTSSIEHLEENMRAGSVRLTEEEFREMASVEELTFTR
jgi:aryl-alcohol dehydrogenase-like predicted oxidoreductase